jgi:hypothetical protein
MSRIDHALNPSDASSAVSSLDFDTNWLLEISNETPEQVMPHIERIYSIMNRMQLVTSRFARVCNDNDTREQAAVREIFTSDDIGASA